MSRHRARDWRGATGGVLMFVGLVAVGVAVLWLAVHGTVHRP
ncbi:hypothetical protein [Streptomyces luteireticuli]